MPRKLTSDEREWQARQFERMADALEHQLNVQGRARVYTTLRHCSRSGMRRIIDLKVIDRELDPLTLTLVGQDVYRYDYRRNGYVVDGCGMDMGFALVDSVMYQLRKWCEANGRAWLAEMLSDWQSAVRHDWI